MKKIILAIALLLLSAVGSNAFELDLAYTLGFAPPHNEPKLAKEVARYYGTLTPRLISRYVDLDLTFKAWGTQKWRNSSVVGHGWEAWENSDWSVDEYRIAFNPEVWVYPFDTKTIGLYVNYYFPFNRASWKGPRAGDSLANYWLIVGIGGSFNLY